MKIIGKENKRSIRRVYGFLSAAAVGLLAAPGFAQQGFYRDYYAGIAGSTVAELTNNPAFPNAPTTEGVVSNQLETGVNIADAYGQRLRARLTPTVTGDYTFWIASDDASELWLGTNAFPASRRRIAYVNGWTNSREWTREAGQRSALIALAAGSTYYIEALHKEGSGGDNLAVAWRLPGEVATNVIPASAIQPYYEAPALLTQPASVDVYEQWAGLQTVTFSVTPLRSGGVAYQWTLDGADIPGATQASYALLADAAHSNRLFRCRLTSLGGTVTSDAASYRFVPDALAPSLTRWSLSHDRRALVLTFSEPVLDASLTNGAFSLTGATVLSAARLGSGSNVVLRLASPLAAGAPCSLALIVSDCASPANLLALSGYAFTPSAWAAAPAALVRGGVEPPGPSSRRSSLVVSEINHTPAARSDGRDLRFVELYNSNPFYQDVGGHRFSGAFDYTLPAGTSLPANGYLVVAPAPADVAAVYGITNVLGGFAATAFDGSSEITLNDEEGAWLTTINYADDPPWPVAADGSGHSLVLARPSYGERAPDGWAASARLGGSPGAAEPPRPAAYEAVLINEVLAHAGAAPGFVELHNASTASVSLAGCVIKRDDLAAGFTIPEGTTLPAAGFVAFDELALGFKIDGAGDTLWLFAPAASGGEAIDAMRFDDQEAGVPSGRCPDGDAAWNRLSAATPGEPNAPRLASEVVLSEIMYHPISEDNDDEYVELHNPGTNDVSLAGWKLGGDVDYAFTETIAAGGFLIVPHSRSKLALLYPGREALMAAGGYAGSLDNGRGTVTLSKPATVMDTSDPESPAPVTKKVVVEAVTYRDGGEWAPLADGGGSSLERVDPRADPRLARSWAASDESQKSEWVTLSFTGLIDNGFTVSTNGDPNTVTIGLMDGGECLVDLVEVKASGGANLVSNPSFEAGADEWRFMGTHDASAVETNAAAPDGARVLHLRASDRCHNSMNICRGLMSAMLPKSGTGTISVRARWLSGCPELLARTRGSWLETCGNILTTRALGTPGLANSRAAANAAPALFDVTHHPLLPRNGEAVAVFAKAQDPDGILACTLSYRVEGLPGVRTVAMSPAHGGYFAGEIPGGQSNNVIVAFSVEAFDAHRATASARFPASAPARECLVRYNEPLDSRAFGCYRFWMTKENIAYWTAREKGSNKPVDATFVYGTNRVFYGAGMMYAGSPFHSSYTAPINPGANIDYEALFQSDDALLDDDGLVLSTIGNLGSGDDIGIREQFCYSLVHALEIPNMYRRYVHLYANGAEQNPKKIFEDTEKPNAGVLKHWFPEDSNNDFFKVDDWFEHSLDLTAYPNSNARLQKYTTTAPGGETVLKLARYRWNWQKRGYETFRANDYTNFFQLVEALNVTNSTYMSGLRELVNLEDFVPVIAANRFIGNYDSYGYNRGKNMYLYDSQDGWQLIAWDLDFNFGFGQPLNVVVDPSLATMPCEDPTMRTFLKAPDVARLYWRCMQRLISAADDAEIRAWSRAKYDALKADSTVLNGSYEAFFTNVLIRTTNVVAQLSAANPTNLALTVPAAGYSTATQNVMTIAGVAPFSVTTIRVNGVEVPLTWTSASNWTAQVVLNSGTNTFTVQAYGEDGSPLPGGSATRAVAYTGEPLDPMERFLGFAEIMAAPATNGAGYVEIANRSATTHMNLSGYYLAGAVSYAFSNGTVLKPGDLLCVVENAAVFGAAYGTNLASKVAGAFSGKLPSSGTLLLKRPAAGFDPDDPVIDRVDYWASDPWPAPAAPGTSLRLINPDLENSRPANWTAETTLGTNQIVAAVPWSQTWKYYLTNYPGAAWAATNYADAAWSSGPGPLGKESATLPIPLATTITLYSRLAYYFRTSFVFTGETATASLALTYMLDDGAVFYLNGTEIRRSSLMPTGTVTDATASGLMNPEGQIEGPFTLSATNLVRGTNVLAVSVHQNVTTSSDLVFGMKLDINYRSPLSSRSPGATNALNATLTSLPDVWLNEVQPLNASGPADNAGEREPWAELYNSQTSAVSLAGWSLAPSSADPGWAFPSNATLAAGEFLRVWLDGEPAESAPGHLHASLRFACTNGLLLLRAPVDGRAVAADALRVTNAAPAATWGAYPDGASEPRRWLYPATPAASNRVDKPACRIVLNECMAQNDLFLNPLSNKKDDWLELFNDGSETVDLGGYIVTDTLLTNAVPTPDPRNTKSLVISNGVALAPGHALRIWTGASNSTGLPFDPANLQAPFGLGKSGDQICLFNAATQLVDHLVYATEQSGAASLGRWLNGAAGEWTTFGLPTPGQPNRNPRAPASPLAQPALQTAREEQALAHTLGFAGERPANTVFRLFPAEARALPEGLSYDADSGALAWTPAEEQGPGLYALRACAFAADGASVDLSDEVLLTIKVLEAPSRPVLGSLTNLDVSEGGLASFTATFARHEEVPFYATQTRLTLTGALPTNATFSAETGLFSWPTAEVDGPGTNVFVITAEDAGDPGVFDSVAVTVTVREVNSPLVYAGPTTFYLWRGEPFALRLPYEDADLPPNALSFSLTTSAPVPPAGLTVDPVTGVLTWLPSAEQTGAFGARILATDRAGSVLVKTLTLVVDSAPFQAASLARLPSGEGVDLRWASKPGARYTVEWSPSLAPPDWRPVNEASPLEGTGEMLSLALTPDLIGAPTNAFFRIIQTR
jgi:hypothetical protein